MICPKCNKEYDESLGACPYCDDSSEQSITDTTNIPQPTKEFTEDKPDQGVNPPQYDDGFAPTPNPSQPLSNNQAEANPNINQTDNGNKQPLPMGAKIAIVVGAIVVIALGVLFATGVFGGNKSAETGNSAVSSQTSGGISNQTDMHTEYGSNGSDGSEGGNSNSANANSSTNSSGNTSANADSSKDSSGSNSANADSSKDSSGSADSSKAPAGDSSGSSSKPNSDGSTVTINGETFKVGDKITYSVYMSGINKPVAAVNITTHYDSALLEVDDSSFATPNLSQMVYNTKLEDKIKFNAIDVTKGFDFAQEHLFYQVSFVIKEADVTACDITTDFVEIFDVYQDDITGQEVTETVTKE